MPMAITSIDDLFGHLTVMILGGSNFESPEFPDENIETMFSTLLEGISNLSRRLGEAACVKLISSAEQSREHYEIGEVSKGNLILQHMREYVRLKKYKSDEPVVDEARFQQQV